MHGVASYLSVSIILQLASIYIRTLQQLPYCNSFVRVTLTERRCFHTAVQVFKVLYQHCPGYLKDWFVFAEAYIYIQDTVHGQNTHRSFISQINTSIGKNGQNKPLHD